MKFPDLSWLQDIFDSLERLGPELHLRRQDPHLRIFLVGFMGAGKSYLGKKLAYHLSMPFIDLDDLIERESEMSINQIFEQFGEKHFRKLERKYLRHFKKARQQVVATGGGTPSFHRNMSWMKWYGVTIYLQASPELLAERLKKEKAKRPLIAKLEEDELLDFIKKKLKERSKYYNRAKIILDQDQLGDENALSELIRRLRKMKYLI